MTYSLQFSERMVGAFTFGEHDYRAGYRDSGPASSPLAFHLTIRTDDVDALVTRPGHPATPRGYVDCDALGGRLAVEDGTFDLFVDEEDRTRHMLYRLFFADATGRPLTLAGFKDVRPGPVRSVWPETSTLYTRVLAGNVVVPDGGSSVTEGVVGSGILVIRPLDFAWQLSTFRVRGPTWRGRARAFDAFARLFLGELWQVFDPPAKLLRRG